MTDWIVAVIAIQNLVLLILVIQLFRKIDSREAFEYDDDDRRFIYVAQVRFEGSVVAGQMITFDQVVEEGFEPQRLVIPSEIAVHFNVDDIQIERKPQLKAPISGVVFSEVSTAGNVFSDDVEDGDTISLTVTNCSPVPRDFHATLIGYR